MPNANLVRNAMLGAIVWWVSTAAGLFAQFPPPPGSLDKEVDAFLKESGAPGLAVVLVVGDRAVVTKGYGLASIETRVPVDADTLFQIGSVTKSITAAAILTASAEGGLPLDRPVGGLVSGLTPCIGQATVEQLLSHSGGLIDEPAEYGPQGEDGLASYPRSWREEYCLIPPGRAFSYSNSGYALAGLALQEREKKPFADVIRARVLEPLGMTRTTFRPTEAMTWPLATGHRRVDGVMRVVRPLPNDARLWPAGTVYSSANEMGRLVAALLNDGRTDGRQALPSTIVRQMLQPRMSIPTLDRQYGYGLELDWWRGQRRAGHAGTMTGYSAAISLIPDRGIGVALLVNRDGVQLGPLVDSIFALSLRVPAASSEPPASASAPALPADRLDGYVGTYTNPRRFTVEIVNRDGGLVLRRFGRDFPMQHVAPDRFIVNRPGGGEETIAIGLGADGRAEYLQMNVWALAKVRR